MIYTDYRRVANPFLHIESSISHETCEQVRASLQLDDVVNLQMLKKMLMFQEKLRLPNNEEVLQIFYLADISPVVNVNTGGDEAYKISHGCQLSSTVCNLLAEFGLLVIDALIRLQHFRFSANGAVAKIEYLLRIKGLSIAETLEAIEREGRKLEL